MAKEIAMTDPANATTPPREASMRALAAGLLVGALLAVANLYVGLAVATPSWGVLAVP